MTIAAGKIPYHRYSPGSAMSAEAIPFEFLDPTHLTVQILGGDVLSDGVDYEIAGDWRSGNGTIRALIDAGASEWELFSDTPDEQQLDLQESRKVPLPQYERELDRQAIRSRETRRDVRRAMVVPLGEDGLGVPSIDSRRGFYFAFDADGKPIAVEGTGEDGSIRPDLANPAEGKGADLPVYRVPGFGSIVRTVKDKLLEIVSVKDKGATGDGSDASAAFTAAGSGAILPPGTYALDDDVVGDFYALPGAEATGGLRARIYPLGRGPAIDRNAYKKSIVGELPLKFADYEAARSSVGNPSYLYPQGFTYDADGNLFIKYAQGTSAVIVVYSADLDYVGWFKITAGGEALQIVQSGVTRLLYSSSSGNLQEYNISSLPANGATLTPTNRITENVGLQFAHEGGLWLVEQDYADVGVEASRTKFNVYNAGFVRTGEIFLQKTLVGYQTSSSDYYPYIPKMQGICIADGNIYISHGGSYIPETGGPVANPVSDFGVTEVAMDGSIVRRGVVNANGLLLRMAADGLDATRTENEGAARHPDGSVHSMLITKRPGDATASTVGIVLFREFDPGGKDYTAIRSRFAPFNSNRLTDVYPRSPSGILDPLTLQPFTTLNGLIKFMADFQLPRTSYYSSAITLTALPGMPSVPSSAIVEIRNANNSTFLIAILSVTGPPKYYRANKSGSSWSATSIWEPT